MYNLKTYQIYHDLIAYFATLISLKKKSQLGLIFRIGGSITILLFTFPYLLTLFRSLFALSLWFFLFRNFDSESGQMCAIKEVRVFSDDQTSKECLKQLNQVIHHLLKIYANDFSSHPMVVLQFFFIIGIEVCFIMSKYYSAVLKIYSVLFILLQEINLLSSFSHPNIVEYYGSELVCWIFIFYSHMTCTESCVRDKCSRWLK